MTNCIVMENISKMYDGERVLRQVNLCIQEGKIFGLLGPSGAGKTTIIKILTGQIYSDTGKAMIFNTNCEVLSREVLSRVGMVLDNSGLYERLTCYDNLLLFARIFNVDKQYIDEVLKLVGIVEAKNKCVHHLSKGMRQRLVLARALLHSPKLLFLDEPTSGLDPRTSNQIHQCLLELKEKGTTIFLTTHNMQEAYELCDEIALLHQGEIIESGEPELICRKHNQENSIDILYDGDQRVKLLSCSNQAERIYEIFKNHQVEAIHSTEPNLATVFMNLTGKELDV